MSTSGKKRNLKKPRKSSGSRREYTDGEKAEALIKLAVNKHDIRLTASELDIPLSTLRRWAKIGAKKGVGELLERAIERMLMVIPVDWVGTDWGIVIGILIDKHLLMQGEPTSRTESVFKAYQALTDEEREYVSQQARRIIEDAGSSSAGGSVHEGSDRS